MADVALSSAIRSNLLSLSDTTSLINRTQNRLSTGLAVSSPVDDAVKYFQAKSLSDRASDLTARKNGIEQGINALTTAVDTTTKVEKFLDQMKGMVDSARSGDKKQRAEYSKTIVELSLQIQKLVGDATYQGLNLVNSTASTLTVRFSDKADSSLKVDGNDFYNFTAFYLKSDGSANLTAADSAELITGLGFSRELSAYEFTAATDLAAFNGFADLAIARLDATISNVRAKSATIANNVAILQVRLDFTKSYVDTLEDGSGKLTLANLNEEGANLLALQTRQQLGIQSLAFAGQAETSIMGLFR